MKTEKEKKQILYDSSEAARYVGNIKGWVDINNRFFGDNKDSEHMARWSSHTHKKCECGELMQKGWSKCNNCIAKASVERYYKLPFVEWEAVIRPVYSDAFDTYFFNEDEIDDFCEENNVKPNELMLLQCKGNYFAPIDFGQWQDIMPEEVDELPKELVAGIEALNKIIDKLPPASYSPGKIRTEYQPQ